MKFWIVLLLLKIIFLCKSYVSYNGYVSSRRLWYDYDNKLIFFADNRCMSTPNVAMSISILVLVFSLWLSAVLLYV